MEADTPVSADVAQAQLPHRLADGERCLTCGFTGPHSMQDCLQRLWCIRALARRAGL